MVDGEVVTVTRWPDDAPGTQLLSIRVDKSVDDLFLLAYGSSTDFTVRGLGLDGDTPGARARLCPGSGGSGLYVLML